MGRNKFVTPSLYYYSDRPWLSKRTIPAEDLFPSKYVLGNRVLLDGSPGSGKTVLCHHYCKRWAEGSLLEAYFLVVYIALRDIDASSASRIEDLLSYGKDSLKKAVADELQTTSGEGTLFILDGWDELQHELQHKQSLVCKILLRKVLPKCSVLITSRPHCSAWLKQSMIVTKHLILIGFTEDQVKKCVASEFCKNPSDGDKFVSMLESRPDLAKLCNIPLNLAILMYMYKANNHTLPNTMTKIYQKFMINALHYHMSKSTLSAEIVEFHTINELPCFERELYKAMRKLSFDELCNGELVFSRFCLERYHSDLPKNALGLMTATKTFTDTGIKCKYQFIHATVQEFLAAEELSIQTPDNQVDFLRQHLHEDRFRLMIIFFCGQAQISPELESIFRHPAPILGSYSFYQHWYQEQQHQIRVVLLLMEMILESQNEKLCWGFSLSMQMSLDFSHNLLSKHDCFILANFLSFGGCKWRALNLDRCEFDSDAALNQFSEILSKSPRTLQFENVTFCLLGRITGKLNQLLQQPPFQSLNALKLQRPVDSRVATLRHSAHRASDYHVVSSERYYYISSYKCRHISELINLDCLHNLSSVTVDTDFSGDELYAVLDLVQRLKSLTSLQLLCSRYGNRPLNSATNKTLDKWLPQCKTLQIRGLRYEFGCETKFLYSLSQGYFRNVQILHLTDCGLNTEQAHWLFTYLHNSSITELNLSENHMMFMSSEVAKAKLKSFFPFEKQIQFKESMVNHSDAAKSLKSFLKSTKTLVILNLSGCGIDAVVMEIIANEIFLCTTLREFHVADSKISGLGMSTLCSALASTSKPRTLLPNQPPTKLALFLQYCDLNNEDAIQIANVLQSSSQIAGLDLSSNCISASGASAIMSSVCNSSVKTINLSNNYLDDRDTQKLSQAFERALSLSSEVENLTMKDTNLKSLPIRGIALGLVNNSSLTCLKIQSRSGDAVLVDLLNAVTSNRILKKVCVDVNELDDVKLGLFAIVDPISKMLQNNNTLSTLKLGRWIYHHSQCQDLITICQALRQNFTLTKLTLILVQRVEKWPVEGETDLEKCAVKESDSVNLIRAKERKPYVTIKVCFKRR